eukprot:1144264-Pelagomonas_calceolata.AAC.3
MHTLVVLGRQLLSMAFLGLDLQFFSYHPALFALLDLPSFSACRTSLSLNFLVPPRSSPVGRSYGWRAEMDTRRRRVQAFWSNDDNLTDPD